MALSMTGGGGGTATPSGTLDPGRQSLVDNAIRNAQSSSSQGTGSAFGNPMWISLNGKAPTREVRLEGKGWRTLETGDGHQASNIDAAINAFYLLDDAYREKLMKQMWYYGLINGPNDMGGAVNAWKDATTLAWNFTQAGKPTDPVSMFPRMTTLKAGQLGHTGGPQTQTQRSINFTDPGVAKAWIREAFQASMGRDPHDAEIRSMMRALASGERSDPTVSTQVTDVNGNTTTTTDAGFDSRAYIANTLASDPEARAAQAASTYYGALEQALSTP